MHPSKIFAQWVFETSQIANSHGKIATIIFADCAAHEIELYTDLLENMHVRNAKGSRVVLISRMFQGAVFKFGSRAFKFDLDLTRSFQKGTNRSIKIWHVAEVLKQMDSHAFWNRGESLPISDFYKASKCIWKKQRPGVPEQVFYGYLDVQTALLDSIRFQSARRALLRVCALMNWPRLVVTDSLISDVVSDALREFPDRKESRQLQIANLFLGSTVVSGDTLLWQHKFNEAEQEQFITLLTHRDANAADKIGTLLYWMPPEIPHNGPILRRVSGTPYVSEEGDYSTTINRFKLDAENNLSSLYVRSPNETYSDFMAQNDLKMGHFSQSSGHELFQVDLERMLLHSEQGNEKLWQWIIETIEIERANHGKDWFFLIPSNSRNGLLYRLLSDHYRDQPEVLSRFFLVTFLRNRIAEPFLISPVVEDRIEDFLRTFAQTRGVTIIDMAWCDRPYESSNWSNGPKCVH